MQGKLKAAGEYLQNAESYDAETEHAHARMLLASRESKKCNNRASPAGGG